MAISEPSTGIPINHFQFFNSSTLTTWKPAPSLGKKNSAAPPDQPSVSHQSILSKELASIARKRMKAEKSARLKNMGSATNFITFANEWLTNVSAFIKPNTRRSYSQYVKTLSQFLGDVSLGSIDISNVRAYQKWRSQMAGATRINAEVSALSMILKEAGLWKFIVDVYRPLPISKVKVRQNMSEEEERRLLVVALDGSKPRRLLAGHCLVIMANTSMGFGELRHLKREDLFLDEEKPFITVNGGLKNDYRRRAIPLNYLALRSMRWVVQRWQRMGGSESDQYILPHHARRSSKEKQAKGHKRTTPPLFDEPMGHIYRAARSILTEAGLSHLDPYDMRSHFITKLLSDPNTSEQVYGEIVGHVSKQMRMRYSKQRLSTKYEAVSRVCMEKPVAEAEKPRLLVFAGSRR